MNLYRIISLETFIDLLHNKRERYVRPTTWEDTFEGYLYTKLYDVEERKKLIHDIYIIMYVQRTIRQQLIIY